MSFGRGDDLLAIGRDGQAAHAAIHLELGGFLQRGKIVDADRGIPAGGRKLLSAGHPADAGNAEGEDLLSHALAGGDFPSLDRSAALKPAVCGEEVLSVR